jgi:tRNA-uridine aminocarboxypropyltransferase
MRAMCSDCGRPESVCLCAALVRVTTRTRVVILQHPRESNVPINTARIAERALPNSERHVGVEFGASDPVRAAVANAEAPAILLYPGPGARDLERDPPAGPVTLTVIDGTWWQAHKLFKKNPFLAALPRYALDTGTPSRYRIRKEPAAHCVSTIEAIVSALRVLERGGAGGFDGAETDGRGVDALLDPFDTMVEHQLRFAAERHAERHVTKKKTAKPYRPLAALFARAADLVVGYGEANAWPRDTPLGQGAEIVHFAAERVVSGERFEAFIAPRRPLSPSFAHHTGVAESAVAAAASWGEFLERWQAFARPTDVLGGWGHYWAEALRGEGLDLPEQLDLRDLARRHLRERTGDVEDCARKLGEPLPAPWTPGRTGRRAAGAVAVARALIRAAAANG